MTCWDEIHVSFDARNKKKERNVFTEAKRTREGHPVQLAITTERCLSETVSGDMGKGDKPLVMRLYHQHEKQRAVGPIKEGSRDE